MEFPLDFLYYLYKWLTLTLYQSPVLPYESLLSHTSINKKIKEKKKKRILNNDLAVLPSYDTFCQMLIKSSWLYSGSGVGSLTKWQT